MELARGVGCLAAIIIAGMLSLPALAQSDFTEFFYDQGSNAHFYYSPGSVQNNGDLRLVSWTSSDLQAANNGTEHLVYHAQIDCSAQTITSLSVDRLDAQSGQLIANVDVSGQAPTQNYTAGTMAGDLAARVC